LSIHRDSFKNASKRNTPNNYAHAESEDKSFETFSKSKKMESKNLMGNISNIQQQVEDLRSETNKQLAAMQEQLRKLNSRIIWFNEMVKPKFEKAISNEFN
jgi:hypothetical protein